MLLPSQIILNYTFLRKVMPPIDFFISGVVKDCVYSRKSRNIDELQDYVHVPRPTYVVEIVTVVQRDLKNVVTKTVKL